jgi:hypothetical protein
LSPGAAVEMQVVFESPVRSGFLIPRGLDRDRDRSGSVNGLQKTVQDHLRPVKSSLRRFFAVL